MSCAWITELQWGIRRAYETRRQPRTAWAALVDSTTATRMSIRDLQRSHPVDIPTRVPIDLSGVYIVPVVSLGRCAVMVSALACQSQLGSDIFYDFLSLGELFPATKRTPRRTSRGARVSCSVDRHMLSALALTSPLSAGFVLPTAVSRPAVAQPTVRMGMFDGLAKAFENDDSLGERKSAGLSKEKAKKTVTWVGPNGQKKLSTVVPGQNLRDIARVRAPLCRAARLAATLTIHLPCARHASPGFGHQDQIRLQ